MRDCELRPKEKGQSRHDSVPFLRLPTMPLFSWGIFSIMGCWKPARKDARASEKPQLLCNNSIFVPGWIKKELLNHNKMLENNRSSTPISFPA
jgi:hypothetical protein